MQYLGYVKKDTAINLTQNVKLNVEINEAVIGLKEVAVVSEKENKNVTSTEMSTEKIDTKQINSIPVLFGEKDILKTAQLLPGIKTVSEGNTGLVCARRRRRPEPYPTRRSQCVQPFAPAWLFLGVQLRCHQGHDHLQRRHSR